VTYVDHEGNGVGEEGFNADPWIAPHPAAVFNAISSLAGRSSGPEAERVAAGLALGLP
jgi:hypothetical protein